MDFLLSLLLSGDRKSDNKSDNKCDNKSLLKPSIEKSPRCGFNCKTFRLKSLCTFSPKFSRSDAVHRRGNRWTDGDRCQGTHTVRCAEMGTTTRSGGGARAPSASTAPYAAAQATPPPPPLALPARRVPRGSGEMRYGHMLHGVRAEQGCARSKERRACVLLGAMSGCRP